jgi:hypothetical protein
MIRILVSPPAKTGLFPYRIDGHWGPGGAPLIGITDNPVLEASRILHALGVEYGTPVVFLFHNKSPLRTTIRRMLAPPQKALPPPRRARRKALVARGSGVPGDG